MKHRTEWFTNARFGMFIHWGIYSIPAEGEWIIYQKDLNMADYERFAAQFNPVDFDPGSWADLAKDAGMKYVVFTTKHHDGFCMFDSRYTDYKITRTPYLPGNWWRPSAKGESGSDFITVWWTGAIRTLSRIRSIRSASTERRSGRNAIAESIRNISIPRWNS